MDSSNLRDLHRACTVRLTMNNGETLDIEKPEFIMVGDFDIAVVVDRDGRKRNVLIALDNISSSESLVGSPS